MNRIALIIALLVSSCTALSADDQEKFEREIAAARMALLERFGHLVEAKPVKRRVGPNRFTIRAVVEAFLKEHANDPSKVKVARISKKLVSTAGAYKWMGGHTWRDNEEKHAGIVQKGCWQPIGRRGVAVAVRYRATNRLGALVVDDKVFCIFGGVVFDWMKVGDFHPTRPQKRSDPLTDQFMRLLR